MKKIIALILAVVLLLACCGCQATTKSLGGSMTLELPENEKLVTITWKDDSLWYLTKPMTANDAAETYKFQQRTDFGVFEGTVTVVEKKG